MNSSAPHPHRRRLTRAEVRRRRRSRAIRRVAGLTVMLCVAVGGVSFLLTRHAVVPSASAASAISMPAQSIADSTVSSAENTAAPANALGLTADEAEAAVTALRMRRRAFAKGEILLEAGQRAPALGVVLAGRVHMEHLDVWGSKTLLGQAGPGDLFAETYACLPDEPLRVSVVAAENGEALFLETGQLLQCGCEPWRWKLTQNLLRIAARKNLGLAQRSLYTAPKTIRGRITAYFSVLARQNGSLRFTLPFDRQQLADHLGVDRSALSNALSQMQKDGLLVIDKREVELKQVEEM